MNTTDWIIIAIIFLGVIVRTVGRSLKAYSSVKYKDNPERREKVFLLGKVLVASGSLITIVTALVFIAVLSKGS